ncbi:MAG TPA: hypothetical protein VKR32_05280, partial [Puia sp.]|nr:hypothetical protein [Puia sp.]
MISRKRLIHFSIIILMHIPVFLFCQKKNLDFDAYKTWPRISQVEISNDGKFLSYVVGTPTAGQVLLVQSLDESWKMELAGAGPVNFTENSRQFVFMTSHDSMGILNLNFRTVNYVPGVSGCKMPKKGNGNWLGYMQVESKGELVLFNLLTKEKKHFQNVTDFEFNDDGSALWLRTENGDDSVLSGMIRWVNLETASDLAVFRGRKIESPTLDPEGGAFCFFAQDSLGTGLYYYKAGMDSAELLIDDSSLYHDKGMVLNGGDINFIKNDDKCLFWIKKPLEKNSKLNTDGLDVTIQNYQDELLREKEEQENGSRLAMVNLKSPRFVMQLLNSQENLCMIGSFHQEDYMIIEKVVAKQQFGGIVDSSPAADLYCMMLKDSRRRLIKQSTHYRNGSCSFTGKYIVW